MSRRLLIVLGATFSLAACGGGGGTVAAPPVVAPSTAPAPPAPLTPASFHMSIAIPRGTAPANSKRSPRFFSPGEAAIAVYDGSTLVYVANLALDDTPPFQTVFASSGNTTVTFGDCSFTNATATCDLTFATTTGQHLFDFIAYPVSQGTGPTSVRRRISDTGTAPAFTGIISSEGELSVNLNPGTNAGQTVTLLGVASQVLFAGPTEAALNVDSTFGYRIEDSTNSQIVQPGNAYDNGPVTITASPAGIVTIVPNSITTPPATPGDQNFDVTCVNAAGGDVTITLNAGNHPTRTFASGLSYSSSNYPTGTIFSAPFTCDGSGATIPIIVQGRHK